MSQTKIKETSIEANNSMLHAKKYYQTKFIEALKELKVGATTEEISRKTGIPHEKIWKRASELEDMGMIFNTTIKRKNKSGRMAFVWQLYGLEYAVSENPPIIETKKKKQDPPANNPLFNL